MKALLVQWRDSGLSQAVARERLLAVWRELDVKQHDPEIDFLVEWFEVIDGMVGLDEQIW